MHLEPGIKGSATLLVDESKLAKNVGSGNVALLSSPIMIALMEQAAWTSLSPYLDAGQGSVGISVEVKHNKATPPGQQVTAQSELLEIKGKRLIFRVTAADEQGPIGEGKHERVIVNEAQFEEKARG